MLPPAAKKTAVSAIAAKLPAAVKKKPATASKTATVSHAAQKLPAPAVAKKLKKQAAQPALAAKKASAAPTAAQIAQQVLASLKKMHDNKPARKSALLKMIKGQAGAANSDDATAAQVLSLLQARRDVVVAESGHALAYPRMAAVAPEKKMPAKKNTGKPVKPPQDMKSKG